MTARDVGAGCENKQMTGILSRLPHDDYIDTVHAALAGLGIEPDRYWTETPDGRQLDAVLTFDTNPAISAEWPGGVFLGWDQRAGWSLIDTSTNRTLFPLGLGAYAGPQAVAVRAKTILFSAGSTPVDETWAGAAALEEAVKAWEATP